MVLKELLKQQKQAHPTIDERALEDWVGHVLKMSWSELRLKPNQVVNPEQIERVTQGLQRMAQGEPLAYLTGYQYFYKSEFSVGPGVLIPRPETEILVETAREFLSTRKGPQRGADLGTGSGCIGMSLALCEPQLNMDLIEVCPKALSWVQHNLKRLRVSNCQWIQAEVGVEDPYNGKQDFLDLIVANPPYIAKGDPRVSLSVKNFEPHRALYATEEGLSWIHKWMGWSYNKLKPGGMYLFEFGLGQESQIRPLLKSLGEHDAVVIKDYSGHNRFMAIYKKG